MSAPLERTLVIIKPDGVARGLIGEVITRLERKGLSLAGMKLLNVTRSLGEKHYAEHAGKGFFVNLLKFIGSGPVVVLCVEGNGAIGVVRAMIGPTSGLKAPSGTIRGDYALSGQKNLVHASDGSEAAKREIELWFKSDELLPPGKGTAIATREWVYGVAD